jgi:hydrogenase/urease accessory protein HupE
MKTSRINKALITSGMLLLATSASGHTSGEHGGGLVQQLMHILQSTDHLFIILALGVAASFLIRLLKNNADK